MTIARIITDLSYGDAGKGTTIDYLARKQPELSVVIRYNGGPQAAHNIVTADGRHHTFSQFGSGSLAGGVGTHLSDDMLINPFTMDPEADHLIALGQQDIWERLTIDRRARVITPWHIAVNRLREQARGDMRHGSCAQGVGETMADELLMPDLVLRAGDFAKPGLSHKLDAIRRYKLEQSTSEIDTDLVSEDWDILQDSTLPARIAHWYYSWSQTVHLTDPGYLAELADRYDQLLFEGAQGVLLDEWFGFHPYTTWSTTTPENARRQLDAIGFNSEIETLGILRAYTTRHGPGPLVTEDVSLSKIFPEYHNDTGQWQGAFRYGHFDAVAHRYAIDVCGGIDRLVVTGVDRFAQLGQWQYCHTYDLMKQSDRQYFDQTCGQATDRMMVGRKDNLDYQERLSRMLASVSPQYDTTNTDEETIIGTIERELGVPVGIVSKGPTAADKCERILVS